MSSLPKQRWSWKRRAFLGGMLVVVIMLAAWVGFGPWPDPEPESLPWTPDAIVVLGGGDEARPRQAIKLSERFPDAPIVVTGDGGQIVDALRDLGVPEERLRHEDLATSTMENARFTESMLDEVECERAVLVTNWFHVPRSLSIFRAEQPDRDWAASFEPRPAALDRWNRGCQRRERLAALHHLLVHQIWCFGE